MTMRKIDVRAAAECCKLERGADYTIKEASIGRGRAGRCVWRVDEWMRRLAESDSSWNSS